MNSEKFYNTKFINSNYNLIKTTNSKIISILSFYNNKKEHKAISDKYFKCMNSIYNIRDIDELNNLIIKVNIELEFIKNKN